MTKASTNRITKRLQQKADLESRRYALVHERCGRVALYLRRLPVDGDALLPKDVLLLNGRHPQSGEPAVCGHCNVALTHDDLDLANIRGMQ